MLVPLKVAKKRKMTRRAVFIIVKDWKGNILLTKNNDDIWNISAFGDIFAGESAIGAALRLLNQNFGIENIKIHHLTALPFQMDDDNLTATVFIAGPLGMKPIINSDFVADAMFVNNDDLEALLTNHSEMFAPLLDWALRAGWFGKRKELNFLLDQEGKLL